MKLRLSAVSAATLAIVATMATETWGEEANAVRQARRHMEAGQEYFLQERWENAAEEFLEAHTFRPHVAFLFNAALAYHRQGQATRAIELYERYLAEAPEARDRATVENHIRVLQEAVQARAPASGPAACQGSDCAPSTEGSEPPCAEGQADCAGSAPAASGDISAVSEGSSTETPAGEIIIIHDPVATAAARAAQMKSVILVEAEPSDALVILLDEADNEVARGQAPLEHPADAGRYFLVLEHPEYRTTRTPVTVSSGRYYVFHIEMSQPPAFLQVISNVPGSTVYLDDRSVGPVGTTPWAEVVRTGTHRLWVEHPGYGTTEQTFEIQLGQERSVEVELRRLAFGVAQVLTNVPESMVSIDGREVGVAPLDLQLPPGQHQLSVSARRMKDYETSFSIEGGRTTRILVRLNPRPSRTSAWVSLAFSALTFGGAGAVGWYSKHVFRELETLAENGRLTTDDNRIDVGLACAIGADVGFGLGTLIAGFTLYYFLRDPLPPSQGRVEAPVDFTENPAPAEQQPTPDTARTRHTRRSRFSLGFPSFSPGLALVF